VPLDWAGSTGNQGVTLRRPGQITASNFCPEIASDRAGEMQQAIQLFLRVS
jgi:hypothetical protein